MEYKKPIEWVDKSVFLPQRIILTERELEVPGLKMFGKQNGKEEFPPLPNHYHPGCFEFTYLAKGSIIFSVENVNYYMYPGDVFITPPNIVHSTDHKNLALHLMYWFQVDIRELNNFLFLSEETASEIVSKLYSLGTSSIFLSTTYADREMKNIFENYCTANIMPKEQSTFELLSFIMYILQRAKREDRVLEQSPDILKVIHYISKNIKEKIDLDELSSIAGLSTSRFKQKFANQIGMSPRVYINYEKVKQSRNYLLNGYSVTSTGMEFNFSSSNYFCVVFKRYFGISPLNFAKKKNQEDFSTMFHLEK